MPRVSTCTPRVDCSPGRSVGTCVSPIWRAPGPLPSKTRSSVAGAAGAAVVLHLDLRRQHLAADGTAGQRHAIGRRQDGEVGQQRFGDLEGDGVVAAVALHDLLRRVDGGGGVDRLRQRALPVDRHVLISAGLQRLGGEHGAHRRRHAGLVDGRPRRRPARQSGPPLPTRSDDRDALRRRRLHARQADRQVGQPSPSGLRQLAGWRGRCSGAASSASRAPAPCRRAARW